MSYLAKIGLILRKIVDLYRQAGAFVEDLFLRQRLRTANVGLDRYVILHLTFKDI